MYHDIAIFLPRLAKIPEFLITDPSYERFVGLINLC